MINDLKKIPVKDFTLKPFPAWGRDWFLLCVGDYQAGRTNLMTVGWGFFGTMWSRPAAIVAVRPQRWSMHLLEEFDTFTLCALPEELRSKADWCGQHSGADGDKFAGAGLTAVPGFEAAAPAVAESELIVECRKLYMGQLHGKCFADKSIISETYSRGDYHRMICGEVLAVHGSDKYC